MSSPSLSFFWKKSIFLCRVNHSSPANWIDTSRANCAVVDVVDESCKCHCAVFLIFSRALNFRTIFLAALRPSCRNCSCVFVIFVSLLCCLFLIPPLYILSALLSTPVQHISQNNQSFLDRRKPFHTKHLRQKTPGHFLCQ